MCLVNTLGVVGIESYLKKETEVILDQPDLSFDIYSS